MLLISTLKRERGKSKEEIWGISCRQIAEVTHSYFSVSGTVMKKDIVVLWPGLIGVGCPTGSSKCAWSRQRSHLTDAGLTTLEASPACPGVGQRMRKLHQLPSTASLWLIYCISSQHLKSGKWGSNEAWPIPRHSPQAMRLVINRTKPFWVRDFKVKN